MRRMAGLLVAMLLFGLLSTPAMAADLNHAVMEGLYRDFDVQRFDQSLPDEVQDLLPEHALTDPQQLAQALTLRGALNWMSGGLYNILRDSLGDFAKIVLLVLVFSLASALREAMGSAFSESAFNLTVVLCVSVAVYGVMRSSMDSCAKAIENASGLMSVGLPVLVAASAASGRVLSSLLLPGAVSSGILLFARINSSFFLPLLSVYFALALASVVSGSVSLKSLCKVFKQTVTFCFTFLTGLLAGLLSLQKLVTAAADTVATDAAKMALRSVVPVVGGIITDAFGTVLGCVGVLRSSVGAIGIVALLVILLPVAVRVLLYAQLFKIASAVSELFGKGGVPEFLSAVADVWSMLAAMTVCQGVYMIAATAMLAAK